MFDPFGISTWILIPASQTTHAVFSQVPLPGCEPMNPSTRRLIRDRHASPLEEKSLRGWVFVCTGFKPRLFTHYHCNGFDRAISDERRSQVVDCFDVASHDSSHSLITSDLIFPTTNLAYFGNKNRRRYDEPSGIATFFRFFFWGHTKPHAKASFKPKISERGWNMVFPGQTYNCKSLDPSVRHDSENRNRDPSGSAQRAYLAPRGRHSGDGRFRCFDVRQGLLRVLSLLFFFLLSFVEGGYCVLSFSGWSILGTPIPCNLGLSGSCKESSLGRPKGTRAHARQSFGDGCTTFCLYATANSMHFDTCI
jgi:hypothetical protein